MTDHTPTVRPAGLNDTTVPMGDRIAALIAANPHREWTAPQISEHITDARNNGVISAALSTLIKHGRINRIGRGRYTAPADPDEQLVADTADEIEESDDQALPAGVADVLELMRSDGGTWTVPGLCAKFPHHSEISMHSGVLKMLTYRGLVTGHADGTFQAVEP